MSWPATHAKLGATRASKTCLDPLPRVGDHEVAVEERLRVLAKAGDDRRAEGQVWNKVAVLRAGASAARGRQGSSKRRARETLRSIRCGGLLVPLASWRTGGEAAGRRPWQPTARDKGGTVHTAASRACQRTITSTCSQSAPSSTIRLHSSASLAKSEERMEGEIKVGGLSRPGPGVGKGARDMSETFRFQMLCLNHRYAIDMTAVSERKYEARVDQWCCSGTAYCCRGDKGQRM